MFLHREKLGLKQREVAELLGKPRMEEGKLRQSSLSFGIVLSSG